MSHRGKILVGENDGGEEKKSDFFVAVGDTHLSGPVPKSCVVCGLGHIFGYL
jgi:hypothetical protein